ncbi:MAG: hypothetical protein AAF704_11540 [Cyanobacteria bacterium P01_D01_bin.123]
MIDPDRLSDSRIQLHYAIQCIAAVGAVLGTPQADGSQTTLRWSTELEEFIGLELVGDRPFYLALEPVSLTSLILNEQRQEIASLFLDGQTMATALQWPKTELTQLGAETEKIVFLDYPNDFPDHPLAWGAEFDAGEAKARRALAAYFDLTSPLLDKIARSTAGATPVRIWPHHFDIATAIALSKVGDDERSVGVGLSPGDSSSNLPYWYVTPWPYPASDTLPTLASGTWHTEGWTGAILQATEVGDPTSEDTGSKLEAFLKQAMAACYELLK